MGALVPESSLRVLVHVANEKGDANIRCLHTPSNNTTVHSGQTVSRQDLGAGLGALLSVLCAVGNVW